MFDGLKIFIFQYVIYFPIHCSYNLETCVFQLWNILLHYFFGVVLSDFFFYLLDVLFSLMLKVDFLFVYYLVCHIYNEKILFWDSLVAWQVKDLALSLL